jgi:hypothetical protein
MKKIRILHLSSDSKFINHASIVFEKAFPGQNDIIILARSENLKFAKLNTKRVVVVKFASMKIPKIDTSEYENYDLVVFHSLGDLLYPEVFNIPKNTPTIWLGWGYDYYDLIGSPEKLLLPKTLTISRKLKKFDLRFVVGESLRLGFKLLGIPKSRKKAIEKINLFSPVLPNEYDLVKSAGCWRTFPKCARWNYGTIEDNFAKGFELAQVDGDAILIGNSASVTCNHVEILTFLNEAGVRRREIVTPLSYGDKKYAKKITCVGRSFFPEEFYPIMNFMPIEDYITTIKRCGYVIMNHKRQQAIGTVVIMLYLGARVFLREENPAYPFLKEMGVVLSSIQELENKLELLNTPLAISDRERNRLLVSEYWSRERGVERTRVLVKQALSSK